MSSGTRAGFITGIDAAEIGLGLAGIGGGRAKVEDKIDPAIGYLADVKLGDEVRQGQPLGALLCRDERQERQAAPRIKKAYAVGDEPPRPDTYQLIKDVISE